MLSDQCVQVNTVPCKLPPPHDPLKKPKESTSWSTWVNERVDLIGVFEYVGDINKLNYILCFRSGNKRYAYLISEKIVSNNSSVMDTIEEVVGPVNLERLTTTVNNVIIEQIADAAYFSGYRVRDDENVYLSFGTDEDESTVFVFSYDDGDPHPGITDYQTA